MATGISRTAIRDTGVIRDPSEGSDPGYSAPDHHATLQRPTGRTRISSPTADGGLTYGLAALRPTGWTEDESTPIQLASVDLREQAPSPEATRPGQRFRVPLHHAPGSGEPGRIQISQQHGRISLVARDASVGEVLSLIAEQHGLNIVAADDITARISLSLNNVPLEDALNSILTVNGFTWVRQGEILLVSRVSSESRLSPTVQGRQMRVFPLNFVAAVDVDQVVKGMLSPVGQSFVTEASPLDKRRTRDQIVIEDLPEYLHRIESYLGQIDIPPRQVLIEAYILQVDLKDETRHGVNLQVLAQLANADVSLRTVGFANPMASPAFFLGVDGTDLDGLLEALKSTTDAKTLATPKVLVVNGQEARIQIGAQLGYLVTTTTQTSTLQNVDFLDVGVVLRVTPVISDDNQVLITVKPEVSSGRINPVTGLPEEETTEVETTIMLPDGEGMIIGGLIKETDIDSQTKVPIVGDLWLVGRLFQRRISTRERTEIIIALVPRIAPYNSCNRARDEVGLQRVTTPLFTGPLHRTSRPWEPGLPDAMSDPRRLAVRRLPDAVGNLHDPYPLPPEYFFPAPSDEVPWMHSLPEPISGLLPPPEQCLPEQSQDLRPILESLPEVAVPSPQAAPQWDEE